MIAQVCNFIFDDLLKVKEFSVKGLACDGNCLLRSLTILLENISYYFVLRYFIADAETILCYVEYLSYK
jgi:hypothetical protein